jgi:uncharacterized protein YdeI (YjbR/CyaY-like superfamily)
MNPAIDLYLADGCGRCKYYKTSQCKVHSWQSELIALRQIVLECGLTEELKWSVPVYTNNHKNIAIVSAFKDYCSLSFFKGALLQDPEKILFKQGESSQSARIIKFTNTTEIVKLKDILKSYIFEAIELETLGQKVEFKKNPEPVPAELQDKLNKDKKFNQAFYALPPGKQRGYIIYFSQPKQPATRVKRIDAKEQDILNGVGLNDQYKRQ